MKTKKFFTLAGVCAGLVALAALATGAAYHAYHHGRHEAASASIAANIDAAARLHALDAYGEIPLTFEQNSGQTDARVSRNRRCPHLT